MYHFNQCGNCTCSLGQGEESSAECFSDIPPCALSRSSRTAGESCSSGSETASSPASPSGTTCVLSTGHRGADSSMSSAADSPARTSAPPEMAQALTASAADSGARWRASFAKYDLDSRSWRTAQCSLAGGFTEFSETWPRWGSMRNGECWVQTPWDYPTADYASGYWPTPSGTSNHGKNNVWGRLDEWGGSSNPWRQTPVGRICSPNFEEQVMGWPIGWTELTPYETVRFQQWLLSHGPNSTGD